MAIGLFGVLSALAIHPTPARACGGFFCDRPGGILGSQPIAQTGENVLFRVDPTGASGSTLEAHIQIFYTGPAAQFSWILPIDAAPQLPLATGSDTVFSRVAAATAPTFKVNYSTDGSCRAGVAPPYTGSGGSTGGAGSGGTVDAGTPSGIMIVFQGAVGPYDAAVIHGSDATEIEAWLSDNGYYVSDQAKGIVETYVNENKYFVALKLMGDQTAAAIRPIVLRFDAQSPCIPLRLTAIASVSNLRVNAWVLAPKRTVPQNYYEITLNLAKLDWLTGGFTYGQLLTQAADEAGGNAFATEYAGSARIMDGVISKPNQYDLTALRAATTPPSYINALMSQRVPSDAGLLAFLEKYIPEPQTLIDRGVAPTSFYNLISYYYSTNMADFAPFDPVAATNGFATDIVAPLEEAQALFDGSPYLTRLSTFISPPQMTKDPLFVFNSDIGDVSNVHTAQGVYECGNQQYTICDAPIRLTLPDGSVERLFATPSMYCTGQLPHTLLGAVTALPALATAWQRRDVGTGVVVTDNTAIIATTLAAASAVTPGNGPAGVGGSFGAGGSTGAGGISGGGGGAGGGSSKAGSGCGCVVAASGGPALAGLLPVALAVLLLVRRRRAR
jgi:MYXO-CTERM domain-containing protein